MKSGYEPGITAYPLLPVWINSEQQREDGRTPLMVIEGPKGFMAIWKRPVDTPLAYTDRDRLEELNDSRVEAIKNFMEFNNAE